MNEYTVRIEWELRGDAYITVVADSITEAYKQAKDDFSIYDVDTFDAELNVISTEIERTFE
jgi:hypothetical protein